QPRNLLRAGRGEHHRLASRRRHAASRGLAPRSVFHHAARGAMTSHDRYSSPLAERYASRAMLELWSSSTRHGLWRQLWLALAESERELGVDIPNEAIVQMREHLADIDFDAVAAYER